MDKSQALQNFWSGFDIPAYDVNTVPDYATFPYITYEYAEDAFDDTVLMQASIWYRSSSWVDISNKFTQIAEAIGIGGKTLRYDDGAIWLYRSTPFMRRSSDPSDEMIRRIIINIQAEYFSAN